MGSVAAPGGASSAPGGLAAAEDDGEEEEEDADAFERVRDDDADADADAAAGRSAAGPDGCPASLRVAVASAARRALTSPIRLFIPFLASFASALRARFFIDPVGRGSGASASGGVLAPEPASSAKTSDASAAGTSRGGGGGAASPLIAGGARASPNARRRGRSLADDAGGRGLRRPTDARAPSARGRHSPMRKSNNGYFRC